MTDKEFDEYFSGMETQKFLEYMAHNVRSIYMKNGNSYTITSLDDIFALVEQELYEEMTGRQ